MKKSFIILLAAVTLIACIFAACSSKNGDDDNNDKTQNPNQTIANSGEGLDADDTVYGFETEVVTDKKGKAVTDKDGKKVTREVQVVYKKDKKGKYYAQIVDPKTGDGVTNKKGDPVTIKSEEASEMNNPSSTNGGQNVVDPNKTTKPSKATTTKPIQTTAEPKPTEPSTKPNLDPTVPEESTKPDDKEEEIKVPKTSATGVEVDFNKKDAQTIANMLKVPKLYEESYENSDGVPLETATYTAIWMCERNNTSGKISSSPVVLDLFRYYGQTVVNFKKECNSAAKKSGAPISYNKSDDTFNVSAYPKTDHDIVITKIEDLENNYFKVTADVKDCKKATKVVAIVQKNKLDINLGFSIKALKWS